MAKIGDKRPSEHCPPYCNGKNCYDRFEAVMNTQAWVSYCKSLKKIAKAF